jgi:hypothetical protein
MTIRVALLVDSLSRRAHGNAASQLALGLVETGRVEVTIRRRADPAAQARRRCADARLGGRPAAVRGPRAGLRASLGQGRLRAGADRGDERRLPVITTDAHGGGPRFVTGDGKYGLLVPPGNQDKLAEAMVHMLQAEERTRYSKLGEQRAEALSPISSANALVDFLTGELGLGG